MTENQGSNSKGSSVWKTIDDVNATFDGLSIMNGGKIKLKSPKTNIEENNSVLCEYCNVSNCIHQQLEGHDLNSSMFIQEQDCINSGVLSFKNGCLGTRSVEDIDTSLQAELEQVFPGGFSNERIEKHWQLRNKCENGEELNFYLAAGNDDKLANFDDSIKFKRNNKEIFFKYEDEMRACSPPLTTASSEDSGRSSSSCFSQTVQEVMKLEDVEIGSSHSTTKCNLIDQSNDSVNSSSVLDNCIEIKTSVEGIRASTNSSNICNSGNIVLNSNHVASEKDNKVKDISPSSSLGREQQPKKCRNALLNGLLNRGIIKNQENKFITLKKPEDFLIPTPNIPSKRISANYYDNSDEFVYCKEDFPAL